MPTAPSTNHLTEWLGALPIEDFCSEYLRKAPVARAGAALRARSVLDWNVLARVLSRDPDVLVVARGKLLPVPAPRTLPELRGYLAAGVGLCVRHTERHDPGLAAVAASFAELGAAQVQLFVTPGGTHGFGWHYDDEDVFIAQTDGIKDYYFRDNTVATDQPARAAVFARFGEERSPLCTATLVPGDFLYLPARWWHMAMCQRDALSISVGVTLDRPPAS